MKLNDIPVGSDFILKRTGEKYTKLDVFFYKGRSTHRFNVKPHKARSLDMIIPPNNAPFMRS